MSKTNNPYNVGKNPEHILLDPGATGTTRQLHATTNHIVSQLKADSVTDVNAQMVGGGKRGGINLRMQCHAKESPKIAAQLMAERLHDRNREFVFTINGEHYKARKKDGRLAWVRPFKLKRK